MKIKFLMSVAALSMLALLSCNSQNKSKMKSELKSEVDSLSYSLGVSFGSNLKPAFENINPEIIAAAIADVYANSTKMNAEDANQFIQGYFMKAQAKKGEANVAKGKEFLENNKKDKDVVVTASGLQYKVITMGTGAKPASTDNVTVHYEGKLMDGTIFDSSIQRGEPATFGVSQVIPGWTEALQLMPEGSKWMLYIPSELAYGERGAGGSIGPNEVLIFTVELLSIAK